jgi:hypothetical protein
MQKAVLDTFPGYPLTLVTARLVRPRTPITADPALLRFFRGESRLLPFLSPDAGFTPGEPLTPDRLLALRSALVADEWAPLLIYYPPEVVQQIWLRPPRLLTEQVR